GGSRRAPQGDGGAAVPPPVVPVVPPPVVPPPVVACVPPPVVAVVPPPVVPVVPVVPPPDVPPLVVPPVEGVVLVSVVVVSVRSRLLPRLLGVVGTPRSVLEGLFEPPPAEAITTI